MMSDNEEEELYDEFGNYIGPDLESSSDEGSSSDDDGSSSDGSASDVSVEGGGDNGSSGGGGVGGGAVIVREEDEDVEMQDGSASPMNAVVLHEDKEHYESADKVYGEEVRTAVLDEDAIDLDVPLVEPVMTRTHHADGGGGGDGGDGEEWIYDEDYLTSVLLSNETTRSRRMVAVVGHFHHGKTCFLDFLLEQTLHSDSKWGPRASLNMNAGGGPRYTDIYKSEQDRHMSLVSTPICTLLPDTRGKTYCFTMLDCPGHPNFHDESVAALRGVDGAVVVVDCVEGVMMHTEMVIKQAISEGLPIVLLINKMDRLIVELKLPPRDCYFKLLDCIDRVNQLIQQQSLGRYPPLSPARGNVAFASSQHGWLFTLPSFAQLYLDHNHATNSMDHDDDDDDDYNNHQGSSSGYALGSNLSVDGFAKRLWGNSYLDPKTRTFHKSPRDCATPNVQRTFIAFILEPLYKIYTACLGEKEKDLNKLLRSLGVLLNKDQLRLSARPLLRIALSRFFQTATCGFVDMIVQHVPCPAAAAVGKISRGYTGPLDDHNNSNKIVKSMMNCNANGPLVIHCFKLYSSKDGLSFSTLGRIYSGTIKVGEQIKVLGEGYSPEDDEDMMVTTVGNISIPRGRYRIDVNMAKAGNLVLLDGVDGNISKTATIVRASSSENNNTPIEEDDDEHHIFAPLKFAYGGGESVIKLAMEPLNPSDLPKMIDGLRRISKAYPMAKTRVEESGEHIVMGTGELYLDCIMHDLRHVYSDIEIKVADPVVSFRETVIDTSSIKCFSETTNKRNKLTYIAEPLDEGLAEKLEAGKVNPAWDKRKLGRFFQTKYDWDLLSSRSIWAFGDSPSHGTNILMDDTLPSEMQNYSKEILHSCKSSIVQGFQWATREGPLCEEMVRGTKIKILEVNLAEKPIHRGGGQIIPCSRKVVHSSILTATPRLLEPVYKLQVQCPNDEIVMNAIEPILTRRRGHLSSRDKPIPGTLFNTITGYIPILDSFGFETDLRTYTQGQVMVYSVFDHWSIVPGDPLDRNVILHPLEPSPPQCLARELLLKTRRRKGLSDDVILTRFFDPNNTTGIINNMQ